MIISYDKFKLKFGFIENNKVTYKTSYDLNDFAGNTIRTRGYSIRQSNLGERIDHMTIDNIKFNIEKINHPDSNNPNNDELYVKINIEVK